MNKLAIITTHPIQYYAPVFGLLNERNHLQIKVYYTWGQSIVEKYDPAFGKSINWDIPLLDGYEYELAVNVAVNPGSHHFRGIITPDLVNQIESWQPDAILVFGWAYQSHLTVLRYFKGKVPLYFRGDSTLLDVRKGLKSLMKSIFLRWVYSHVDHVFYVGTNNKNYFKKYGLLDSQLSFAPHAVDNNRFQINRLDDVIALRGNLGLNKNDLLLLFAGKFEKKKDPELLMDAFLSINIPHLHLLFVGDGAMESALRKKALRNKRVHFMSFQNQSYMPVVYQASDIFCLPSQGPGETWGLAINEAMNCKKPIVASDKCGCAIDLVTNYNGIVFKSKNINDLKSALITLSADRLTIERFGEMSKYIIREWNFENIAKAIESKIG